MEDLRRDDGSDGGAWLAMWKENDRGLLALTDQDAVLFNANLAFKSAAEWSDLYTYQERRVLRASALHAMDQTFDDLEWISRILHHRALRARGERPGFERHYSENGESYADIELPVVDEVGKRIEYALAIMTLENDEALDSRWGCLMSYAAELHRQHPQEGLDRYWAGLDAEAESRRTFDALDAAESLS